MSQARERRAALLAANIATLKEQSAAAAEQKTFEAILQAWEDGEAEAERRSTAELDAAVEQREEAHRARDVAQAAAEAPTYVAVADGEATSYADLLMGPNNDRARVWVGHRGVVVRHNANPPTPLAHAAHPAVAGTNAGLGGAVTKRCPVRFVCSGSGDSGWAVCSLRRRQR